MEAAREMVWVELEFYILVKRRLREVDLVKSLWWGCNGT